MLRGRLPLLLHQQSPKKQTFWCWLRIFKFLCNGFFKYRRKTCIYGRITFKCQQCLWIKSEINSINIGTQCVPKEFTRHKTLSKHNRYVRFLKLVKNKFIPGPWGAPWWSPRLPWRFASPTSPASSRCLFLNPNQVFEVLKECHKIKVIK